MQHGNLARFGIAMLAALPLALPAAEIPVAAGAESLRAALAAAEDGDELLLAPGEYRGNFSIDRSLTLVGDGKAVFDGEGQGDTIRVRAPDVTLRGIEVRHSGLNLTDMNAGVFVEKQADGITIEDSHFEGNAFGIWLDASPNPRILRNTVHGTPEIRSQDRGNGIHLYAVNGGLVEGNEVWDTRDGIYIDTSNDNVLRGNTLHHLRYGVHYMYSYSNEVVDNLTHDTRTGYALMQSKYLTVTGNRSVGDGNYGILMNYITDSLIAGNEVREVQRGTSPNTGAGAIIGAEGKALFMYNSLFNEIRDNLFSGAEIGIHMTAGSEDNSIHGNAFVDNRTQVKYVNNRMQEWSRDGAGNYWSDYLGWDRNEDGLGDTAYEPNDAVDKVLWKYPLAKLLLNSPAVQTLRWVQSEFPVFRPQGVRDSHPRMVPPDNIPELGGQS